MNQEKWRHRLLDMADLVATWGKDPSTKVGAVIADDNNRVVSVGYNGFPRKVEDTPDRLTNRDVKLALTLHAESNAIDFANRDLEGCTIYVTQPPCSNCAARIAQKGMRLVVTRVPDQEFATRWKDSLALANDVLGEAGVDLVYLPRP